MALKTVTKIKEYFSEEEIILDYNQQIEKRPEFKTFLENSKQVELKAFRKRIETEKFKEEKRRTSDPVHTDLTSWIEEKQTVAIEEICLGYPLAVLKATKDGKKRLIKHKTFEIEATGHPDFGHVQVRDMDLMYVLMTLGYQEFNNELLKYGENEKDKAMFPSRIRVSPYQLLKAIGKSDQGANYVWLKESLARLSSSEFYFKSEFRTEGFSFLSPISWEEDYNGDLKVLEVTFDLTFLKMVDKQTTRFWKMPSKNLKERNLIKKRLLGIIRINKNPKKPWKTLEQDLILLLGSELPSKIFRHKIKKTCEESDFPCLVKVEKHPSTRNWSYTFYSKSNYE